MEITNESKLNNLPDVIEFCQTHNIPADVVGRWVWIKFDSKPDQEIRDLLKSAGFRWVSKRGQWAHCCGYPTKHGKGNPRWKYGEIPVNVISKDEINRIRYQD